MAFVYKQPTLLNMFILMLLLLAPYNNICTVLFAPNGECD